MCIKSSDSASEGGAATASASPPPNKRVKPTSTPTTTNGPNIIATNNGPTTTAALSSSSSVSASSSEFDTRTEAGSAAQYFQFYAYLCQQQNMMQDYTRTATYQRAILDNAAADFNGRVVLDVGAGSGILSFFAAQAGARRVYAVEASSMAAHCEVSGDTAGVTPTKTKRHDSLIERALVPPACVFGHFPWE